MSGAQVLAAVIVNLALAAISVGARLVRPSAVWGGFVVGTLIYLGAGWRGYLLLIAFFVVGVLLTRMGFTKKAQRGLAEPNQGRRGSAHALANAGFAALSAVAILLWPGAQEWLLVVLGGSLASALADTAGSEVGQLYGDHPVSPIRFRPVEPGTEGAVSLEGTAAGAASAALIGVVGLVSGLYGIAGAVAVAGGGIVGNLLESVIGSFPWSRRLGHMTLNFGNTVMGGLAALAIYVVIGP